MNRFYYHYDDEYDKDNEEEDVNKEDRRNESDGNSDEIGVDGNNEKMKIMVIMIDRMMYPGSRMIIGMIVDVLKNTATTENPRKPLGIMRLHTQRI